MTCRIHMYHRFRKPFHRFESKIYLQLSSNSDVIYYTHTERERETMEPTDLKFILFYLDFIKGTFFRFDHT